MTEVFQGEEWQLIHRFCTGLGFGGVVTVRSTYVVELSDVELRGKLNATAMIFLSLGMLLSHIFRAYVPLKLFNTLAIIIAVSIAGLFYFVVETPFYLIEKNREEDAKHVLTHLYGIDDAQNKLIEIKLIVNEYVAKGRTFCDIFKSRKAMKAFNISLILILPAQLCGLDLLLSKSQTIFESSGVFLDHRIAPLIVCSTQLLACFIPLAIIERIGRKMSYLISAMGVITAELFLGLYYSLQEIGHDVGRIYWVPITALLVFVISYSIGFAPVPWMVMAEILPGNIKPIASSIIASIVHLVLFVIVFTHNELRDSIGDGKWFWIYGGITSLVAMFMTYIVPETKGKNLQEIQAVL
ncbi:sugar transporter-like [Holotrichia oblita]|uniref:Sugar transporter-like n=1 Tax=Holotrichia oblita TaxID=644536 RepID=A0ACB9T5C7_HOLOL|nr:sugar transporter-like [Holotrichia oblita]